MRGRSAATRRPARTGRRRRACATSPRRSTRSTPWRPASPGSGVPGGLATADLRRPPEELAGELGRSFPEFGFAVVRNPGIPAGLIARAEAMQKALFALPVEAKMAYAIPGGGGARGYTPFGKETARDAAVHDLKEFWHVGRSLPEGHPLAETMAPNVWP